MMDKLEILDQQVKEIKNQSKERKTATQKNLASLFAMLEDKISAETKTKEEALEAPILVS
jgi:hypothetical protein